MRPSFSTNNHANARAADFEYLGNFSKSFSFSGHCTNGKNVCIAKSGAPMRRAFCWLGKPRSYGMSNVLFRRNPFEIFQTVINLFAILMIDLKTAFSRFKKSNGDKASGPELSARAIRLQPKNTIAAVFYARFQYLSWSCMRATRNAANISEGTNFVNACVVLNWFPSFGHGASMAHNVTASN